jgi:hypothetical protein
VKKLLAVFFAARTLLDNLKAGKPLDQEMLERLDRAVNLVDLKVEGESN